MQSKSKRELKKEEKTKQENIRKLDEQIRVQKKIPTNYKKKMRKQMILNGILGFIMVIFLVSINILSLYLETYTYLNYLRVTSVVITFISIFYFELGYRKDNEGLFLYGVEILALGTVTLFSIYIYYMFFEQYNQILIYLTLIIAVYYLLKIFIVRKKMKRQYYQEQNDIKEIVKK